jgi:3-isopropylmalate/(R)-2-methylmalate dehydratase small subunit
LGRHCLEGLDPALAARIRAGDVLVAGRNFGSGSSREHAVLALKGAGIAAVIAESAARIFFRNAINLGLPVIVDPAIPKALADGDSIVVDPVGGIVQRQAEVWRFAAFAGQVADILASGGFVPHLRAQMRRGQDVNRP